MSLKEPGVILLSAGLRTPALGHPHRATGRLNHFAGSSLIKDQHGKEVYEGLPEKQESWNLNFIYTQDKN